MTIPILPDTERRTAYTIVSPSTGPLNCGFNILADGSDYDAWVEVWDDNVRLTAVTDFVLDSPSGSLATLARPITDARITFTVARSGNIQIVGARRPRRTTQFTAGAAVPADEINRALTDIMATLRELSDEVNRSARAFPGESGVVRSLESLNDAADYAQDAHDALEDLLNVYAGGLPSDPLTRPDGSPLTDGFSYFNTLFREWRAYDTDTSAWYAAGTYPGGASSLKRYRYVATASQTAFSGADTNLQTLAYAAGNIFVFLNGHLLDQTDYTASNGTSLTLAVAADADDELVIFAVGSFSVDGNVSKAGDTMSGALSLPSGGLVVGLSQMIVKSDGKWGNGTATPSAEVHHSRAADMQIIQDALSSTAVAAYRMRAGDGTTSSRFLYTRLQTLETSPQEWRYGFYGDKHFRFRDETNGTYPLTLQTAGSPALFAVNVRLPADPSNVLDAATKQYVDALPAGRNRLINGRFYFDQRNAGASTTTADNAYWADRWRYIGEASADCKGRDTTLGSSRFWGAIKFTGTTDKGGAFQVIEGINCKDLASRSVTLSAALAVSNTRLGNIKMGIAEFTGTEDSVSGDPISSWGADGVTPTLAANWAFLNTPANLNVTTSDVTYSVTATCGASTTNLAVIIWNDDKSYTANDTLYFTDVQLERGSVARPYEFRQITTEGALVKRYYQKSYAHLTAPGTNTGTGLVALCDAATSATTTAGATFRFGNTMRSGGTITIYPRDGSPTGSGQFNSNVAGTNEAALSTFSSGVDGFNVFFNGTASGLTAGDAVVDYFHFTASNEL